MKRWKHKIEITRHICLVIFFCITSLVINAQSFNLVGCKAGNETTAFGIYNNELLYSYGDLIMCGLEINGFGIWNGINWTAFPQEGNINNPFAFEIYKGSLYAAGAFLTIGGKTTNKIARWNGVQWDSVGKGLDDQLNSEKINALAVYKNELYASGLFRQVDGIA